MSLRHKDPIIPTKEGSDPFENCKLGRKKYADVLTSIVYSYSDGFVLAVNNPWGTGKSTFVKMWRQDLKNQGYETLYFNAWENDFQQEVIIALLSELEELKPKKGKTFNTLLEKTATFMTKALPAVAKGVASKAIGSEGVADVIEAAAEFTAEQVEDQIAVFNKKKKGIVEFRESLQAFVNEVDNDKPVVFIIDELDRCRPSYAVEVLEQIKHLFAVEGIVFALSIDKVQLGNAIRGFYGSDRIDADEYLRRFIDLEYQIPEPEENIFAGYLYNYFRFDEFFKHEGREENPDAKTDRGDLLDACRNYFEIIRPTLRIQEKVMAQSRVILKSFEYFQYTTPYLTFLLTLLKFNNPEFYNGLVNHSYSAQELVDKYEEYFKKTESRKFNSKNYEVLLLGLAYLLVCYSNNRAKGASLKLTKKNEEGIIQLTFNSELNNSYPIYDLPFLISKFKQVSPYGVLDLATIVKKINLVDKITT